jgi:hypothetical protein
MLTRLLAFLLIAESLWTARNLAMLVSTLAVYDGLATMLIGLRGLVATLQFTGGWLLAKRRPPGGVFASTGLLAGALLTIFDVGLRLAPTGTYPWLRWQITLGYAAYAAAAVWWLRRHR